jgi:predicted nucleic acid-binding protein
MAKKAEAYVDTSAFISFLDRSDSYHPLFVRLFSEAPRLITSPLVIAEGHAWFLRRYDAARALEFLSFVEALKPLHVVEIGQAEISEATRLLRKFSDQDLTVVDACGLHLMKSLRLRICWSTDRHLALTGVPLVVARA